LDPAALIAACPQKKDEAACTQARQLVAKSCDGGLSHACDMLKSLPK